jgi:hypothetical protein
LEGVKLVGRPTEIVVILKLPIDRLRPVLILTNDAKDAFLPAVVIVVDAGKVIVVPLKIGDIFMLVLTNGCS